ncbi:PPE family protein [Mycobacterium sp.]|uniref:PPE family protein n=1 Tax=Mycobacterium sp. TaxID=1785 RepID=UPI003F9D5577
MEFTTLPPEITSALIHSGPGAESLIAASAAWQQLGTTLEDSAESYDSALSSLAGNWHGPSSAAMVQAVEPYVTWLRTTAQQTQQIASSAQTAAAAFSSVRASVVPTAEVTANRMLLTQLLATNGFGRNLPAIAETEAEYQSMWANNSAAMSRYQAASAQASTLPQFASPTSATNPTALATQASAVATDPAAATSGATSGATTAQSGGLLALFAQIEALFSFSNNSNAAVGPNANFWNTVFSSGFPVNLLSYLAQNQSAQALQGVNSQIGQGVAEGEGALGGGALGALGRGGVGPGGLGFGGLSQVPTAAATGVGVSIGKLTAPPAVVQLLPTSQAPVQLASAASPLPAGESGLPMLPPLMPPPISAGSGWRKRKQPKYEDIAIGAELKGKVIRPPPSAG